MVPDQFIELDADWVAILVLFFSIVEMVVLIFKVLPFFVELSRKLGYHFEIFLGDVLPALFGYYHELVCDLQFLFLR